MLSIPLKALEIDASEEELAKLEKEI